LDLSKKNRAVLAVCVIVALLVALINDQVSSLQRKGIAATLPRPFNGVESSRRSMKDILGTALFLCRSLRLRFSMLFNQESFTELKFSRLISPSLVNSDSCRYKLDLHKFIAFVRQLSVR